MTEEAINELVWSCIKQAENHKSPGDSDGYNEGEVYQAAKEAVKKILEQEEWKNLYSEGLQVGIAMYKEKYEALLAAIRELGGIKVDREGKI